MTFTTGTRARFLSARGNKQDPRHGQAGTIERATSRTRVVLRMDDGTQLVCHPDKLQVLTERQAPERLGASSGVYITPPLIIRPGAEDALALPSRVGAWRVWPDGLRERA